MKRRCSLEVTDAELHAIHAYLRAVVSRSTDPSRERVLIMSDCLGVLDALETTWRAGNARGLRTRDRGAMLESCSVLRARLGIVVFLFVKAHAGAAPNAYADAAAKVHLAAARGSAEQGAHTRVTSRPFVHTVPSDFDQDGCLVPPGTDMSTTRPVMFDRSLYPVARKRAARWVHTELSARLTGGPYVEPVQIARRAHESEGRSWAAVARTVMTCAKLDSSKDDAPVERMVEDRLRVHVASLARKKTALATKGTQDGLVQKAADREARTGWHGKACRAMARGCAACVAEREPAV